MDQTQQSASFSPNPPTLPSETVVNPTLANQPTPPNPNSSENEPEDEVEIPPIGATRKLKSDVWPHYTRMLVNGILKAKCIYCKKVYQAVSTNGTSHLRLHRTKCVQKKIHDGSQKILGPNYIAKGKTELSANQFSSEVSRKELGIMILMHEYPLSIVDHLYFKRFCCSLQPLFKVPSRNTIKNDILTLYGVQRSAIQRELDGNKGRIAITTDMWTATNQKRGYMAVTAHFNDNDFKLRHLLLRFLYLPAPHTSERLAARLSECLLDWNIDSKLSTITLDNCTTNDSLIKLLKQKLVLSNLIQDGALIHMRCSAHILNLIVRDGLDVIKEGVEKIRESVSFWTCTPRRVELFHDTARQCKVTVVNKLVLDCPTRWNSTYQMLYIAIPYKDVFFRLSKRDSQYTSLPSQSDWDFAKIVCEKLVVFENITKVFSGSDYPTANQFFTNVCKLRLQIMGWFEDPSSLIRAMADKMWQKFTKYWDDMHQILAVSVVLDPRYKLQIVEYYAAKFGCDDTAVAAENIKAVLLDMVREYQTKATTNLPSQSRTNIPSSSATDLDFDLFVHQKKKARPTIVTTELDHYLADDLYPRNLGDLDLLAWWKLHGAFSSGGRLLDPHRSKLNSNTVEAMMCARSWIQDEARRSGASVKDVAEIEGVFSSLIMDDPTVEDNIDVDMDGGDDAIEAASLID
ncbi:Putative AC transposase [Linum grandiflorum]